MVVVVRYTRRRVRAYPEAQSISLCYLFVSLRTTKWIMVCDHHDSSHVTALWVRKYLSDLLVLFCLLKKFSVLGGLML
jgi:hypothetical protein